MIISGEDIHRFFRRLIAAYGVFMVAGLAATLRTAGASWFAVIMGGVVFAGVLFVFAFALTSCLGLPLIPSRAKRH